jgi:2-polyprenyl-6-hydroxyphenyl methylase/3-demethylubiquinone-9 3-methyltransferase
MGDQRGSNATSTLDQSEIERFAALAGEWWDPNGKFRPLHQLNPTRLTYIRDRLCEHFGRDRKALDSLRDLAVLDVGCGGGLLCEPLARLGAQVTGLDPAQATIAAAQRHASSQNLDIRYRAARVEDLAAEPDRFDAVLVMEVVEHVPDVPAFLKTCAGLLKPAGQMILSTINRTLKSYMLAIVGAEYVLRWLPVGTHQWDRFVTPAELAAALEPSGLAIEDTTGMIYSPLADEWRLSGDVDVNYLAAASPPA